MGQPMSWRFWRGGETNTWARRGAYVGASLGFLVGLVIAILRWSAPMESSPTSTTIAADRPILYLIPLIGVIVGALAGALVGVGTPRFNPRPEQGGWFPPRGQNTPGPEPHDQSTGRE